MLRFGSLGFLSISNRIDGPFRRETEHQGHLKQNKAGHKNRKAVRAQYQFRLPTPGTGSNNIRFVS